MGASDKKNKGAPSRQGPGLKPIRPYVNMALTLSAPHVTLMCYGTSVGNHWSNKYNSVLLLFVCLPISLSLSSLFTFGTFNSGRC